MARLFSLAVAAHCLLGLGSLGSGLSRFAVADEPAAVPADAPAATIAPATSDQIHQTVDRAITYIQAESGAWLNTRRCAACHHVPMPMWALAEAERQGYAIDKKFLFETTEKVLGSEENMKASGLVDDPTKPADTRPQARGLNMGLPFLAVAARALSSLEAGQQQSLQLIADRIVEKQQPDGSWEFFPGLRRPPINENQASDAVWILLALQGETGPEASAAQREALAKGMAWYESATIPNDPQDKVFKLLLAFRNGRTRAELQTKLDELVALQRPDGGWAQLADLKSDAYSTGQTLYILSLAGYTATQPEIKRAIDFLVATQKPDGSWPMLSRSTPDGSPGSSKLLTPITCAAASWATLGLAALAPKKPCQLQLSYTCSVANRRVIPNAQ